MVPRSNRRLVLLFLAAVLLPCAVLVALAARSMRQERELAEKRATEERSRMLTQARLTLERRLDAIEARELRERAGGTGAAGTWPYADTSVRLIADVENGRVVLPWEERRGTRQSAADDAADALRAGEREEYVRGDLRAAAVSYRSAALAGIRAREWAEARLALGRVTSKLGNAREAASQYAALLALGFDDADEHGIPYALYAASALARREPAAALKRLAEAASAPNDFSPEALYLARQTVDSVRPSAATAAPATDIAALRRSLDARIRRAEQALALPNDFARLGLVPAPPGVTEVTGSRWGLYGREPWFIALSADSTRGRATLIAIDAARVLDDVNRSVASEGAEGRLQLVVPAGAERAAAGDGLPWRDVTFVASVSGPVAAGSARLFYLGTLAVVLGVTLFGAYLLWVDVRRELRVAELRSQFVASVSHELKTPLTAIRMFAETLALPAMHDPQARREYLHIIVNETERLTRLLNNVLDFSRIERGQKEYHLQPTALDAVVRRSARTLEYPLAQQGFRLRVDVADGIPLVQADEDALQQAVLNLLTNAMKYSGASREIDLRLHRSNGEAVVAVRDYGLGISPAYQGRVVEKFFRAPAPETVGIPGAGLGLTLVDHIVRGHGGRLEIESVVGRGSTFSIHLPLGTGS